MHLPTGYSFKIVFDAIDDPDHTDSGFFSVSGLEAHSGNLNLTQGAESFSSPAVEGFSVLVLRRAARRYADSPLIRWLFSHFNKTSKDPLPKARIELLDEARQPSMTWIIRNIYPRSWKLGELNAEKSEVLTETIELYYEDLRIL